MRLRVLGCHGGESPSHRTTAFLVDGTLLLDAGSATRGLTVPEQAALDHIIISHAHLDHIRDLAFLCDNVIGVRKSPLRVYCSGATADALHSHLFNNVIWPDFTKIPNPGDPNGGPTLEIIRIEAGVELEIGGYGVKLVPVHHPVETHAVFVRDRGGTLCYSSDTGPTDELWNELNQRPDLRAFIYEVSFPNGMEKLAEVSGHLTPKMMADELATKFRPQTSCPVLLYHLKPGFFDRLKEEIADLHDSRIAILKPMDEFDF
ncbi:MAG: 3',5'-cyclic-nucleotide phosphodiesterase [Myxococcota bacterium]